MAIIINIDVMMAKRKMSLGELAERVDITPANLSILKNGKAKAIRFSTLEAICRELDCQPGTSSNTAPTCPQKRITQNPNTIDYEKINNAGCSRLRNDERNGPAQPDGADPGGQGCPDG